MSALVSACAGGAAWSLELDSGLVGVSRLLEALLLQSSARSHQELVPRLLKLAAHVTRSCAQHCETLWRLEQFTSLLVEVKRAFGSPPACVTEPSACAFRLLHA